ncbi:MAG TPA: methyltransferase, partial [Chloroflexota bacterium]|nr:methyltransferase [Chloroflexota bacterium]
DRFLEQYKIVRSDEGWGGSGGAYFRALPDVALDDPQRDVWRVRARSFRALIDQVLLPLEAQLGRPLNILDLGAGNGWLAHRLAQRGHHVAAVDVSTDARDGLGASVWYGQDGSSRGSGESPFSVADREFVPVQAEFDRLPFANGAADLLIFNASLHYSGDYPTTLAEALRVLGTDGLLVILDSPVYRDATSGAKMVRARDAGFQRRYGFSSVAMPTEGFLTDNRLHQLGAALGLSWQTIDPTPRWRLALRRQKARLNGRREPASFPVVVGRWTLPLARPSHGALQRRLWRVGLRWRFRLFQRHRYDRLVVETVLDRSFLVLPRVFNPKLLRTGQLLVETFDAHLIPPGSTVLDLGTGSGVGAVFAARWARRVVAVDINPAAVCCARTNVALNQVEDRVVVRQGDLFAPVADERFDVILFNPPYYRGQPKDPLDQAWRAVDVIERFAQQLGDHLTTTGYALVVLSSDGAAAEFLRAFRANGLTIGLVATRDLVNERITIYRVWKARR